jgi:hypothetical protein
VDTEAPQRRGQHPRAIHEVSSGHRLAHGPAAPFHAAPASAATITARTLLARVTVQAESGGSSYDRDLFKHWIDANKDCQATRAEVLISESRATPTYSYSRCSVVKGRWYSYYDGATWTDPLDVDVDHLVALKEAWDSGARSWSAAERSAFANDIAFWASLVAITDNVNSAKGARDPAEWLPPRVGARCTYAIQWVQVKYRWRLSVNATERDRLRSLLSGSCGSRTVVLPARGR